MGELTILEEPGLEFGGTTSADYYIEIGAIFFVAAMLAFITFPILLAIGRNQSRRRQMLRMRAARAADLRATNVSSATPSVSQLAAPSNRSESALPPLVIICFVLIALATLASFFTAD